MHTCTCTFTCMEVSAINAGLLCTYVFNVNSCAFITVHLSESVCECVAVCCCHAELWGMRGCWEPITFAFTYRSTPFHAFLTTAVINSCICICVCSHTSGFAYIAALEMIARSRAFFGFPLEHSH